MNPTRLASLTAALIAAALAALTAGAQQGGRVLPTRSLTAGVHLITAEVATDDASRELGLMHRRSLEPNHGMLFIFDPAFKACMWMRNTLIPLSVAFIDADGRIVNIEEMQAQTDPAPLCTARGRVCARDGPRLVRRARLEAGPDGSSGGCRYRPARQSSSGSTGPLLPLGDGAERGAECDRVRFRARYALRQ